MSFQRRDQFMEIGTALGNSLWDLMSLLEGFCSLLTHVLQEQFDFGTFLHQQGFSNHAAKIKCSFMMEKRYTCHRQIGVLIIWFATEIRTAIPLSLSYMWRKNVVFFKNERCRHTQSGNIFEMPRQVLQNAPHQTTFQN